MSVRPDENSVLAVRLSGGTGAITRPIQPGDGVALTRGLDRLSPEGHAYRFLHYRKRFTEAELHYLTHCDFIDHIALILAILDVRMDAKTDQVGVARCIRSQEEPVRAEVAVVVVDEYQHQGGGPALLRHLARLAWQAGIRRWQAFSLSDNTTAPKAFARVGREISSRPIGAGAEETIYALHSPAPNDHGGCRMTPAPRLG